MSDNKNRTLNKIDPPINKIVREALKGVNLFNQPTAPTLNITPPSYETTMFKKLADDIKQPLERQIDSVQSIADSAKRQAESLEKQVASIESIAKSADELATDSKDIAESAKTSSDIALKESKKADIKGWISIFIAAFGVFVEFAIHHAQVIGFIKSILGV